jgi:hypothetical protein
MENVLNQFIYAIMCVYFPQSFPQFEYMLGEYFQEKLDPSILSSTYFIFEIDEFSTCYTMHYKISPGKFIHINYGLDVDQQKQLVSLKNNKGNSPGSTLT